MKLFITTPQLILVFSFLFSCKTQQTITTPEQFSKNIISFSSGGGFTGAETIYTILENGQVFSSSGLDTKKFTLLSALPKKQVKAIFEKTLQINWAKDAINDPGNIYHTLSFGTTKDMKKQVWGGGKQSPSKEITDLYYELNTIINPKTK